MRTIRFIIQKEFVQIFRNRTMIPIIFLMPVFQMVLLAYAATLEMKNIDFVVVDHDLSSSSRALTARFQGSPFYTFQGYTPSLPQALEAVEADKADLVLVIPPDFDHDLYKEGRGSLQLLISAINGVAAGMTEGYSRSIVLDYNRSLLPAGASAEVEMQRISVLTRYWYNPALNYKTYMVPGILVVLVTVIGMFLTSLNLVREKEMGTIEQINVTPVKKYHFIAGKLIPFWLIALFDLAFGLTIGKLLFDIPIEGSLLLLFGAASVYLLVVLGLGLLFSTFAETQQQVMFINFFFMLVFIMMSGIFTSVESMPGWARELNRINPFFYFMRIIRMILLKGSTLSDIWPEVRSLAIYALFVLTMAVLRYRKTT